MIQNAETRLDGTTLVVRIPMRFQRRGGRKRIVAPDGSEIVPMTKPQPDGTLVKALARAWRWQKLLDDGVYASVSEIGEAEGMSKVYVSRVCGWRCWRPALWRQFSKGRWTRGSCWRGWSGRCRRAWMNSHSGSWLTRPRPPDPRF